MNLGLLLGLGGRRVGGGSGIGVSFTATKVGVDEAPQSVQFVATATGIGALSQEDVVFVWDFGDTYQFRYLPAGTVANDRQSGTAVGYRAAHVYRSAGTFSVTCTAYVISSGVIASGSTSQDVVIAATDAAITSRIAISKSGSFTGAPAGATQVNWSGGEPGSYPLDPNTAYYFEAGQTYSVVNLNAANFSGGGVLKLHRYGAGANPLFTNSGITVWGSNHGNTSICEIDIRGIFDVNNDPDWENTSIYPVPPTAPRETGMFILPGGGATALVYGCSVSGCQINIYHVNSNASSITHTVDCESTNWFDYGVLDSNTGAVAHVGCRYHQKVGTQPLPALALGSRAWNVVGVDNTARQGAIRIAQSLNVTVNKCNLLSYRCGWSTGFGGFAAIQASIRVGTETAGGVENAAVSQNEFEGGFNVMTLAVQNASTAQIAVGIYVAEFNVLRLDRDGQSVDIIPVTKAGAHIRGNIIHYPSGITHVGFTTLNLVFANSALSFALNRTTYVYGNTLVSDNNNSLAWQVATQIGAGTRPITYENNMFELRGTSDIPGSGVLFQTDYTPIQAAFPYAPQAGSLAYRTYSTGRLPPLEQDGTVRVAPFSLGASEEA